MAKPLTIHTPDSLIARAVEEGECHLWPDYCANGTPQVYHQGRMSPVRRVLAELLAAPGASIPEGGFWVSTCGNDACVNPAHSQHRNTRQHMQRMAGRAQAPAVKHIRFAKLAATKRATVGKLSADDVRHIMASNSSNAELARELGVTRSLISRYRRHVSGRYLPGNPFAGLGARA